ncbi:type I-E CRISPR-associated protein Cas6/Cse3/CasE [Glycomyces sp. A-F 0318]|uniref:type I-E CRISPR-associated protein Cas6/Cse3/CasE n=1 Tax=Glycomyces amatae TaxID=2881355 RepID=UPI001E4D3736|nr:type I-E CRISPR-associated protein Cas6/Cse3/CasE [Glycomyces amatae]MCD0442836.1 type I-E CRISPR-associated protein Cas6/Cse3/CasE [Glycomyces amatae]
MPFISRLPLDVARPRTRALLRNPQQMKNEVLEAIKEGDGSERFLWRLDVEPGNRLALFAVTERTRPEWGALWEACGSEEELARFAVRDYEPMLGMLETWQEYAFKLTASPTYSEPHPAGPTSESGGAEEKRPRGTRRPIKSRSEQLNWLLRRAPGAGFRVAEIELPSGFLDEEPQAVPDVLLSDTEVKSFKKGDSVKPGAKSMVTIRKVTYTGRLVVEDEKSIRRALIHGLGSAKAYGAGLLTLASLKWIEKENRVSR